MNKDNNFLIRGTVYNLPEKKELGKYELGEVILRCSTSAKAKGSPQEAFIPVTGWGDMCAVIMGLTINDKVDAFGEIRTREWESPNGKSYTFFSFVAERVVKRED